MEFELRYAGTLSNKPIPRCPITRHPSPSPPPPGLLRPSSGPKRVRRADKKVRDFWQGGGRAIDKRKINSNVLWPMAPKVRFTGGRFYEGGGIGKPPPQATPGKNLRRPPTKTGCVHFGGIDREFCCQDLRCRRPYGRILREKNRVWEFASMKPMHAFKPTSSWGFHLVPQRFGNPDFTSKQRGGRDQISFRILGLKTWGGGHMGG